jgi:hypothetical protein
MGQRAREYYEKAFLPKYKELEAEVRRTPLAVLVWGPGLSDSDLYKKRLQIRAVLRSEGYAAVFSEEIDADSGDLGNSAKARELLQALAADFIVVIHGSPGSVAEVHDFAGFIGDLGRKMLIFIDSQHVGGYSYTGALKELQTVYNNVHTYRYPEDIEQCHLIAAVRSRLTVLRWAKWRASLR